MKYYNKINRNVKLNLKLYFNKESYNRKLNAIQEREGNCNEDIDPTESPPIPSLITDVLADDKSPTELGRVILPNALVAFV